MRYWHRDPRIATVSDSRARELAKRALLRQGEVVDIYVAGLAALTPEHDQFTQDFVRRGLAREQAIYQQIRHEAGLGA